MIINPVTITMPRHELEALIAAASARFKALKGDTSTRRVLENAIDSATYQLAKATDQRLDLTKEEAPLWSERPLPIAPRQPYATAELRLRAHAYADAMGFTGQARTSCVDGFLDAAAGHDAVRVRRLYGDAYRVGYAKGEEA